MKRYTNWCAGTHGHDMLEHRNGGWVRYDEADDEIQRLRHDVSRAMMNHNADLTAHAEALALLRELNDALVIPGWLQPRVDAILDRAEEKS